MNEIEGVSEVVTGGMIARAVEPEAGEDGHTHERNCLNCGAALSGRYCHDCGQKGHVHRTLGAFAHDLLHGVLHFEGKIWRTLPLLAWWPGDLTRRYIGGERARFVSPIALFLFSVFLMFAVFGTFGGPFSNSGSPAASPEVAADLQRQGQERARQIAALERERQARAAAGQPTAELDSRLAHLRSQQRAIDTTRSIVLVPNASPDRPSRVVNVSDLEIETGWPLLDHAAEKARENPSLLVYKLQTSAYKYSWALIPISVPFVWLIFAWRRRFKAYDHVVFVTYSIAFMTLLMVALSLLRPVLGGGELSLLVLAVYPPVHMFRQLKGAYGLRWPSALWRTFALLVFAVIASLIFLLFLLALGLLG
jgi:hypothetical protein